MPLRCRPNLWTERKKIDYLPRLAVDGFFREPAWSRASGQRFRSGGLSELQSGTVPPSSAPAIAMISVTGPMSSPVHHQSSMGSPSLPNQNMGSPFYDDASVSLAKLSPTQ
ncbi:hypothetical protein BIW11_01308 [Tropilaelaps mercedesae]|uniref:Uncharacterized protein n=1 Tax=Tropilaelaps mercedesae TaxID=418985 RepID=A0A1V9XGD9_9ACAR|nr:hypothetical protein BIW11_01308 [Tropilaelaps mercedesae]